MSATDFAMFVVAAIASIAAGLAYAVLTRDEPGFVAAKIFAWVAAVGFGSLGTIWGSSNMTYSLSIRMVAAFVVAGIAAATLTWIIADINGQNKEESKGGDGIRLSLTGDGPFSTVAPAGVNRRRTVRVKIENNTSRPLTNGELRVLNLDPPYRDQTEFLLRGDLAIPAHGYVFADVAYYDEGSSQGRRGQFMYLSIPTGAFFAEAIPTLPLEPAHTFHLKFSTLGGALFAEIYCRLFVDDDHALHLQDPGESASAAARTARLDKEVAALRPMIEALRQNQQALALQEYTSRLAATILQSFDRLREGIEAQEKFSGKKT
jgi:hypothetical protein